jgi:NitT/TauT family transport system permease protein
VDDHCASTLEAFVLAVAGGVALAVLFSQSRVIETALYPYAVMLQVTPIVAIAPLVLIWVGFDEFTSRCSFSPGSSHFPICRHRMGLRSANHDLIDLFRLHRASRWQILIRCNCRRRCLSPGCHESVWRARSDRGRRGRVCAGSGRPRAGWRIVEAGNRLRSPNVRGLGLLSALGISIFFALTLLEWALLHRWHEKRSQETGIGCFGMWPASWQTQTPFTSGVYRGPTLT